MLRKWPHPSRTGRAVTWTKVILILGVGVVILIALAGWGFYRLFGVYKVGVAAADECIRAVTAEWSAEVLWNRADSAFHAATTRDEMDRMFAWFGNSIGPLIELGSVDGRVHAVAQPGGTETLGWFSAEGRGEKAPFEFDLTLVRDKSDPTQWRIREFRVRSPALIPSLPASDSGQAGPAGTPADDSQT